jgi:hypothetical protein
LGLGGHDLEEVSSAICPKSEICLNFY